MVIQRRLRGLADSAPKIFFIQILARIACQKSISHSFSEDKSSPSPTFFISSSSSSNTDDDEELINVDSSDCPVLESRSSSVWRPPVEEFNSSRAQSSILGD